MPILAKRVQKLHSSGIRVIAGLADKIPACIKLHIGIPDFFTPANIKTAGCAAIESNLTAYSPNAGETPVRQALAKKTNQQFRLMSRSKRRDVINYEQVVLTAGGMGALSTCINALLDPGDEIILPNPGWPNFFMIPLAQGVKFKFYPLFVKNNFVPRPADIESQITAKTKVILLNTPANPTGAVIPRVVLEAIVKIAKRHDLWIICDECYEAIIFEGQHFSPFVLDPKRVVVVRSFSKTYAMTGWRVGYTISNLEVANKIRELNECQIACVPTFCQWAAKAALEGPQTSVRQMVNSYKKRRDLVVQLLKQYGLYQYTPAGAFYILIDISKSGLDSETFALKLLRDRQVAVAPGATFGSQAKKYVRICFAVKEKDLREGIRRIAAQVSGK
ncbi:MAG TPA: aminotransferase class I/II [Candidatus Jacksonbacteria bacterium]|nr:MAG: Aminotransferase class I and II [Parcubacteria group bacterium GW2011_GWC2_44_22]HBH46070.1 aminotransferase class I/II [Candidatus Jacksonbacteria bacterium]